MPDFGHSPGQHELLRKYLQAEQNNDPSQEALWDELVRLHHEGVYSELLFFLTRQRFDVPKARRHWERLSAHRKALQDELGRDLGLRAALCDYFLNIERGMKDPILVEDGLMRQQERRALRDDLTGLFNRRFFRGLLEKQAAESQRYHQPFSLLMLDVDRFKTYNDLFGHVAGDRALAELSRVLNHTARELDYVVRYGGEEFAILLPKADKRQALAAAERHRLAVESHPFAGQEKLPGGRLSVSIGAACFPTDALNGHDLLERSDEALYAAKSQGRNRVCGAKSERRRHPRTDYRAPVEFRYQNGGQGFIRGETANISLQGLGIWTDIPVEPGRLLELILHSKDADILVRVEGRAVRVVRDANSDPPFQLGVFLQNGVEEQPFRTMVETSQRILH